MDRPSELDRGKNLASLVRIAPPFVGRRQELDWLVHVLQEATSGHPRVVLIPGEAGIGKTRLLQEARSIAQHYATQIGYGRCYEDLTLPYLPFVGILHPFLEHLPPDVERTLGAEVGLIRRLLNHGGASISAGTPSASAEADQEKLRLFLAVSRVTITLARRCPALLIVDDLHWADRSSLDLFGHLVFTVADAAVRESVPLLIVGTYRPAEPETRLARLIARMQRETICQTIALSGLNDDEIRELIQALGLTRPSQQLTATVSEATRGNPLFIQEVLHHLIKQDALQARGGYLVTTASAADLQLPEHVVGALIVRTQGLSSGCRRVLKLASFLGESFSLQALSAVVGSGEDEVLAELEEARRQRLLLSEGQAFQFAHPLIRQVFYSELSAARRQRLHCQIAQSLEGLYAEGLEAHVLEIAHHLVRAGPAADADTVLRYARRAADQAFRVSAWGEAAHYYGAALSAGESSARLSTPDRAELHYLAGLAYYRDQDVGPCIDHYETAIAAYRQAGDVRGLARALMEKTRAHNTFASVPYGTLLDTRALEDTLAALGESEPGLRGGLLAVMSEVYRSAKQTDKAEDMARQALDIGQHIADDRLCAYANLALGLAQVQGLHLKETLQSWQASLAYARRTDDLWLQGWPLTRMPHILISLGRFAEAEAAAREAAELTDKTNDWADYSLTLSALTFAAVARGDFAAAERHFRETMRMASRSGYPWGGARALSALACGRALRGAWTAAEDALGLLVEPGRLFDNAGPVIQAFARTYRQLLRAYSGAVVDVGESSAADLVRAAGIDSYALAPYCALVELADLMAAPAIADQPRPVLALAADQGVLFTGSSGWVFLIPRVLGIIAVLHRQWDEAEAHFQAAIEVATRLGARPELGRTHLDYARMLAARGRKDDRRRAIELLRQASAIFHELSMEPFIRRAAQCAEALQARKPPVPQPATVSPDHLSAQEVEILLQLAQGRTDQEIADTLVLSPQTVARHVSGLFDKLGVQSRAAAAAYGLEHGFAPPVTPPRTTAISAAGDRMVGAGATHPFRIVLVTDMASSTALIQRLGDAQAYELLQRHNAIIRDCLRAHHGFEVLHTGDGVEASFLSASSAVACAVAIQQAFARYNREHPREPIPVRIGINAGEPIPTEGRLFGTAVHTAFRICSRAQPGQILVSDVVRQLAASGEFTFITRGRITLKGLPKRVRVHAVRWQEGGA